MTETLLVHAPLPWSGEGNGEQRKGLYAQQAFTVVRLLEMFVLVHRFPSLTADCLFAWSHAFCV